MALHNIKNACKLDPIRPHRKTHTAAVSRWLGSQTFPAIIKKSLCLKKNVHQLGYWSGTLPGLVARYVTPYGSSMDMMVFECSCDKVTAEKLLHKHMQRFRIENELFRSGCIAELPLVMADFTLDRVAKVDMPGRRGGKKFATDAMAILGAMTYSLQELHEKGIRPTDGEMWKADLISEVIYALGFDSPFDVEHVVAGYEQYEGALMKTAMYRDYKENIKMFDPRVVQHQVWKTSTFTQSISVVLKGAGLIYVGCAKQQRQRNKTRVRNYVHKLETDSTLRLQNNLRCVMK